MSRLQFDLSDEVTARLDELQTKLDLHTRRELFRNALAFLHWAVDESTNGNLIGSRTPDGQFSQLLSPALEEARRKGKS